jgi:hypothetical protein
LNVTERRFSEDEVAAIFRKAAEAQHTNQQVLPSREGLTLRELHDIAREVGIAPELIDSASTAIARAGTPTSQTFLGLPIGVGRTIDLGRKLSEEEWDRLVVDMRETFNARGRIRRDGTLRQWSNGNLQALLEPTATGQRVRLRTVKGDARGMIGGGLAMLTAGATGIVAALAQGATGDAGMLSSMGFLATMGGVMFGLGALRLPGWARLRRKQMSDIAERLAAGTDQR